MAQEQDQQQQPGAPSLTTLPGNVLQATASCLDGHSLLALLQTRRDLQAHPALQGCVIQAALQQVTALKVSLNTTLKAMGLAEEMTRRATVVGREMPAMTSALAMLSGGCAMVFKTIEEGSPRFKGLALEQMEEAEAVLQRAQAAGQPGQQRPLAGAEVGPVVMQARQTAVQALQAGPLGVPAGQAAGQAAGEPAGQAAGQAVGQPAGQAVGGTAGQAAGQAAGGTVGQAAGEQQLLQAGMAGRYILQVVLQGLQAGQDGQQPRQAALQAVHAVLQTLQAEGPPLQAGTAGEQQPLALLQDAAQQGLQAGMQAAVVVMRAVPQEQETEQEPAYESQQAQETEQETESAQGAEPAQATQHAQEPGQEQEPEPAQEAQQETLQLVRQALQAMLQSLEAVPPQRQPLQAVLQEAARQGWKRALSMANTTLQEVGPQEAQHVLRAVLQAYQLSPAWQQPLLLAAAGEQPLQAAPAAEPLLPPDWHAAAQLPMLKMLMDVAQHGLQAGLRAAQRAGRQAQQPALHGVVTGQPQAGAELCDALQLQSQCLLGVARWVLFEMLQVGQQQAGGEAGGEAGSEALLEAVQAGEELLQGTEGCSSEAGDWWDDIGGRASAASWTFEL